MVCNLSPCWGVCKINFIGCSWLWFVFPNFSHCKEMLINPNKSSVHPSIFIYTNTCIYTCTYGICIVLIFSTGLGVPKGGDRWKGPTIVEYVSDPLEVLHLMLTRSLRGGQYIILIFYLSSNWRVMWYLFAVPLKGRQQFKMEMQGAHFWRISVQTGAMMMYAFLDEKSPALFLHCVYVFLSSWWWILTLV